MKQKGGVIVTHGSEAVVSVLRKEACVHCAGRVVCGNARPMSAKVKNSINASVGDTVIVETEDKNALFWLFLIFIAPIILSLLMTWIFMSVNAVLTIIMGVVGFAFPFVLLAFLSRNEGIIPTVCITEIISIKEENVPCDTPECEI